MRFENGIVICSLCRSQTVSPAQYADKAEKEIREWSEPLLDRTQVVQASSCHWVNDALRAVKHLLRGNKQFTFNLMQDTFVLVWVFFFLVLSLGIFVSCNICFWDLFF